MSNGGSCCASRVPAWGPSVSSASKASRPSRPSCAVISKHPPGRTRRRATRATSGPRSPQITSEPRSRSTSAIGGGAVPSSSSSHAKRATLTCALRWPALFATLWRRLASTDEFSSVSNTSAPASASAAAASPARPQPAPSSKTRLQPAPSPPRSSPRRSRSSRACARAPPQTTPPVPLTPEQGCAEYGSSRIARRVGSLLPGSA
mmetsp:Transcript_96814/g.269209  ORF Transcript_96814/g.269209 Transcript_96814/m.269209 type:complete len:205 (-) Transcript_96814:487-1101(-)